MSKAQSGAQKGEVQKRPFLFPVLALLLLPSPLNSTQRQNGDESVEQLENADEIGENNERDEWGSTPE